MRRLAILLLVAAVPLSLPAPLAAQSSATGPDITVTGENRIICRRITRTATRMRSGRVCHTQAQWTREAAPGARDNDPNATIDGAADTLELQGEKISTNCTGGGPTGGPGPY